MTSDIKMTRSMARLLHHLLLMKRSSQPVSFMTANTWESIGSAAFYPNILRLEYEGWVQHEWEELPDGENRPPRCFYTLTVEGERQAKAAVTRYLARPSFLDRLVWRKLK